MGNQYTWVPDEVVTATNLNNTRFTASTDRKDVGTSQVEANTYIDADGGGAVNRDVLHYDEAAGTGINSSNTSWGTVITLTFDTSDNAQAHRYIVWCEGHIDVSSGSGHQVRLATDGGDIGIPYNITTNNEDGELFFLTAPVSPAASTNFYLQHQTSSGAAGFSSDIKLRAKALPNNDGLNMDALAYAKASFSSGAGSLTSTSYADIVGNSDTVPAGTYTVDSFDVNTGSNFTDGDVVEVSGGAFGSPEYVQIDTVTSNTINLNDATPLSTPPTGGETVTQLLAAKAVTIGDGAVNRRLLLHWSNSTTHPGSQNIEYAFKVGSSAEEFTGLTNLYAASTDVVTGLRHLTETIAPGTYIVRVRYKVNGGTFTINQGELSVAEWATNSDGQTTTTVQKLSGLSGSISSDVYATFHSQSFARHDGHRVLATMQANITAKTSSLPQQTDKLQVSGGDVSNAETNFLNNANTYKLSSLITAAAGSDATITFDLQSQRGIVTTTGSHDYANGYLQFIEMPEQDITSITETGDAASITLSVESGNKALVSWQTYFDPDAASAEDYGVRLDIDGTPVKEWITTSYTNNPPAGDITFVYLTDALSVGSRTIKFQIKSPNATVIRFRQGPMNATEVNV